MNPKENKYREIIFRHLEIKHVKSKDKEKNMRYGGGGIEREREEK